MINNNDYCYAAYIAATRQGKLIYALIDTSYTPSESLSNYYFSVAYDIQKMELFLKHCV